MAAAAAAAGRAAVALAGAARAAAAARWPRTSGRAPTAGADPRTRRSATRSTSSSAACPKQISPQSVWTWDEAKKELKQINIRVGVSDGTFSELISGRRAGRSAGRDEHHHAAVDGRRRRPARTRSCSSRAAAGRAASAPAAVAAAIRAVAVAAVVAAADGGGTRAFNTKARRAEGRRTRRSPSSRPS